MVAQAGLELAVYLRMILNSQSFSLCLLNAENNVLPCLAHKQFVLHCMLKNAKCQHLTFFLWGLVRSPEKKSSHFLIGGEGQAARVQQPCGEETGSGSQHDACRPLHGAWNLPPSFSGGPAVPKASKSFHLPCLQNKPPATWKSDSLEGEENHRVSNRVSNLVL